MAKQNKTTDISFQDFLEYMQTQGNTNNELFRRRKEDILSEILGISSDLFKVGDANKRIKDLRKEGNKLKKPRPVAPRNLTRSVQQSLDRARDYANKPMTDAEISALRNQQIEAFLQGKQVAQSASTGNAAQYGALGQSNSNAMLRGSQALEAALSARRSDAMRNLNYATMADVGDRESVFRDNFMLQKQGLEQYNTESQFIGNALAASQLSRLQGIDSLVNPLARLGSRADVSNLIGNLNIGGNDATVSRYFDPKYMGSIESMRNPNYPNFSQPDFEARPTYDYNNLGTNVGKYNEYVNNQSNRRFMFGKPSVGSRFFQDLDNNN